MRRKVLFAYTLLELMMGIFLVFCAAGYLLGTYAFGSKASLSTDRFTTAINLGQAKMEELQSRPPSSLLSLQKGTFPIPHQDYYWTAQTSNFSDDFILLTVRTGQKNAPLCTLRRLLNNGEQASIDAHLYDSEVVFTDNNLKSPFSMASFWQPAGAAQKISGLPSDWHTGAICGHPGQGLVWLSHNRRPQLAQLTFNDKSKNDACKIINIPKPSRGYEVNIVDIATDKMGNFLFCADSANRALWVLDDSNGKGTYSWKNGQCLISQKKPINDLCGVDCEQYGSSVWLCEGRPRRLRQFFWGNLPQAAKEKLHSYAAWGDTFEVPFSGIGNLHSVAVNSWGSVIYTMDNCFIYTLIFQENDGKGRWLKTAMPERLRQERPRALWIDPGNSRLYINTLAGKKWVAIPSIDGILKAGCFSQQNWR